MLLASSAVLLVLELVQRTRRPTASFNVQGYTKFAAPAADLRTALLMLSAHIR